MWVESGCLRVLRERLDTDASIAIAAPANVDEEGFVPALSRGGVVSPDRTMDHWFPAERVRPSGLDTSHRLDWVASSGALVRVAALDEVGGADPAYFPVLWGDVDLGHRLTGAGHRVVVVPEAIARHRWHGSTTSFLRDVVAPVNAERFRTKGSGVEPVPSIDVDRDIVDAILPVATGGFVDLAGAGQRADDEWRRVVDHLRADLDELHVVLDRLRADAQAQRVEFDRMRDERDRTVAEIADLRTSRSMRITAPLRATTRVLGRLRDRIRR